MSNFFSDPEGLEDLREDGLPPGALPRNPLLNDEPSPHPDDEKEPPRVPSWKAGAEEEEVESAPTEEETAEEAKPAAKAAPQGAPQAPLAQPSAGIDYNALAQAIGWAMAQNQPRPQPKPEDFDPPEIELPSDEEYLEGRASIKKDLRRVQVETARHMRDQFSQAMAPVYERLGAYQNYIASRVPVDEANARSAARSYLLRQGLAQESDVEEVLDSAGSVIANDWNYRTDPRGWVSGAYVVLNQSGAVPVRKPAKPPAGAGRGDAPAGPAKGQRKAGSIARKNPHIRAAEQLLGKPLSEDRLAAWEEKFA